MKQNPLLKGNKAAGIVLLMHGAVILLFALYTFFIKFPVFLWDDGFFLNTKFIDSTKAFLISTLEIWFGIPILLGILNAAAVKHISLKYLAYIETIRNTCGRAGQYFREHYPEQMETIAKTTYFSGRIELLQKDAQTLEPEKLTAVFRNLRRCRDMEREFHELVRRCENSQKSYDEQALVQNLQAEFRNYLSYSAVLLNQYYPEQMQNAFSHVEQYLSADKPEQLFREKGYASDTLYLLSELYAPLETLAQDLQIIADYVVNSCQIILEKNSASEMEAVPLPGEISAQLQEAQQMLKKLPSGDVLLELSGKKDKKSQKKYAAYAERFQDYQESAALCDKCVSLFYEVIADTEHWLLEQLLSHYHIVQNAYRMWLPEDSPFYEEYHQAYDALKTLADSGEYTWHLYYLHIFSETQHRRCDVSLSSHDVQNLQCRLDAVKSCAEMINQTCRKDEVVS